MNPREFLEIWLALNSAIYSQIALFSSLIASLSPPMSKQHQNKITTQFLRLVLSNPSLYGKINGKIANVIVANFASCS